VNGIYREWSGYYAGLLAFMMVGYALMQFPPTRMNLVLAGLLLLLSAVGCALLVGQRVILSDFPRRMSKAYALAAFLIGAMCLLGAATK